MGARFGGEAGAGHSQVGGWPVISFGSRNCNWALAWISSTQKRISPMKVLLPVLFVVFACPFSFARSRHSSTKAVKGSGCVEQAVETSCRVVIDSQTGDLYNLLFPAKAPQPGTAIQFAGTPQKGTTACMQGKPVKVSKWKKEKGIKCPPPVVAASVGR